MGEVWVTTTLAALAGGVLWVMANIFSIVFAPTPPPQREVVRALAGSAFALISALIGGYFVAPYIVRMNGVVNSETISLIGLFVGMGFWAAVPVVVHLSTRFLPAIFGNLGGVLKTAAEADAISKSKEDATQ